MVHLLFEDFLESPAAYDACRAHWQTLVADVLKSVGQEGEWPPWIPLTYADGKTLIDMDGNPIFDGRSERLERAFRIIQFPATATDEPEIAAWLKHYEEEYEELPREELVISLSLSEETADLVRNLLRKWFDPTTTIEQMQAMAGSVGL